MSKHIPMLNNTLRGGEGGGSPGNPPYEDFLKYQLKNFSLNFEF